jgi:hypothetical protein
MKIKVPLGVQDIIDARENPDIKKSASSLWSMEPQKTKKFLHLTYKAESAGFSTQNVYIVANSFYITIPITFRIKSPGLMFNRGIYNLGVMTDRYVKN